MKRVDLRDTAADLREAWSSRLLGRIGGAGVKVLRMDGRAVEPEVHGTAEALLVLDGMLHLTVGEGETEVDLRAGELYVLEAGVRHAVRRGSAGTLVIVEQLADVDGEFHRA